MEKNGIEMKVSINKSEDKRPYILFWEGDAGNRALLRLGNERVYAFCDNDKAGQTVWGGKSVIDIAALKKLNQRKEYRVMICCTNTEFACGIARQLQECGMDFEICEELKNLDIWCLMHIVNEEIAFLSDNNECAEIRKKRWYPLYRQMLEKFGGELKGKKIDFWIFLEDKAEKAYWAVKFGVIEAQSIFAFNTTNQVEDVVIPLPDYMYYSLPLHGELYDECVGEYAACRELPYESEKAFWCGNLACHSSRETLYALGKEYPDELEIKPIVWGSSILSPMTEWHRYKYLIDVRGIGWTDRLKMLFLLGRPIFVNERPYTEFWMKYGLEAGKHYISVKEDFSDLLEKKKEMDSSPEKYEKMKREMQLYATKYLTKDFALQYMKDAILKYAT